MEKFVEREETNWLRVCKVLIEVGRELLLLYFRDVVKTSLLQFLVAQKPKMLIDRDKIKLSKKEFGQLFMKDYEKEKEKTKRKRNAVGLRDKEHR